MPPPHFRYDLYIPAGLDLELDALIAQSQVLIHALEQRCECRLDAEAHADRRARTRPFNQLGERLVPRLPEQVQISQLQPSLGHIVPFKWSEARRQLIEARD